MARHNIKKEKNKPKKQPILRTNGKYSMHAMLNPSLQPQFTPQKKGKRKTMRAQEVSASTLKYPESECPMDSSKD